MRKMIWYGTALLVFGACALFFVARYAAANPESFLGRCARAAYYVGVRSNPLVYLSQPAANDQGFAGKPVAGAHLPIPPAEFPGDEVQEAPAAEQPQIVESIVVEDGDEGAAGAVAGQTVEPARIQDEAETLPLPPPPTDKDVDRFPTTMPYADDEDAEVQELATQAETACMTEFFRWLVAGPGAATKQGSSCCKCLVESIAECIKDLFGVDADSTEQLLPPAEPIEISPAGQRSGEESQEIPTPTPGAGFRENPNYNHQYPSCPYTGPCPYPHSYNLPPVTAPRKNADKPVPQSHLILDEEHIMQWTQATTTEAGLKAVLGNLDSIVHTDVDTMECRPTDVPDMDNDETF